MAENKTKPTDADVDAFIEAVPSERRRGDARTLVETSCGGSCAARSST